MKNRRGIKIALTFEEFVSFTRIKKCHYCKAPIAWNPVSAKNNKEGYNLDRKDNSKGYFKSNLVVCCPRCNKAKGNAFSYKEWVRIGKVIQTFA